MSAHLRANLWLLVLTVLLCSVLYPLVLLGIGQTVFHDKAQGSLLTDAQGHPIGSQLIAQPFTADEYFQPRPSAASYNAAASGASNWAASNYLLRDRVARQLGPIVKYQSGPKKGQPVGPDIESWFQKDQFDGKPGIVAQWAALHSGRRSELDQSRQAECRVCVRLAEDASGGSGRVDQSQSGHAGAEARRPGGAVLHRLLQDPSGHVPQCRRAQDAGRKDGKEDRAGKGRHGHPGRFLRHVAAGASRRGPGARPCRHGDGLRLGPRSRHYARATPFGNWIASPPRGQRRPETPTRKSCTAKSSSCCGARAMRRWAAWSACRL